MSATLQVKVLREGATLPRYQTPGAAGFDLHACTHGPVTLQPGETKLIGTGLAIYVAHPDLALFVTARSGNALKYGIGLANGIGLIDSDYQGELATLLQNRGKEPFTVNHGDRIAQAVLAPVYQAQFEQVAEFDANTVRGSGGFGSTGQ